MRRSLSDRLRARTGDAVALLRFLSARRSRWLTLLVLILALATIAMYVTQSAAVAPFVYPLF